MSSLAGKSYSHGSFALLSVFVQVDWRADVESVVGSCSSSRSTAEETQYRDELGHYLHVRGHRQHPSLCSVDGSNGEIVLIPELGEGVHDPPLLPYSPGMLIKNFLYEKYLFHRNHLPVSLLWWKTRATLLTPSPPNLRRGWRVSSHTFLSPRTKTSRWYFGLLPSCPLSTVSSWPLIRIRWQKSRSFSKVSLFSHSIFYL